MSKSFISYILILNCFCSNSQTIKDSTYYEIEIQKATNIYNKIVFFENKYEEDEEDEYQDSIFNYNYKFSQVISKIKFSKDNSLKIKKELSKINVKMISTNDNLLIALTWQVFGFYPIPLNSNIIIYKNKPTVVSINGTGDNDYGDNIGIDKVQKITLNKKPYYLVFGSNKCGNLCIQETLTMYKVFKDELIKNEYSFKNGKNKISDLKFDYLLNQDIKITPCFKIQGEYVLFPIFNKLKTKLIAYKKIKISSQ